MPPPFLYRENWVMTVDAANSKCFPANCPRCDWLGNAQSGKDTACPLCGSNVNLLKQKGLGNLRLHYRHLFKIGYKAEWTIEQRTAEQLRIEDFFKSFGSSL